MTQSSWARVASLVVDERSRCKLDKNGLSPLDKISTVKHTINLHNSYAFGFPRHVLLAKLQDDNGMPLWDYQVRFGAYLGHSKIHASNDALMLNL